MFEGTTQDAARPGLPICGLGGMSIGRLSLRLSFEGVGVVVLPTNDDLREPADDIEARSSGIVG